MSCVKCVPLILKMYLFFYFMCVSVFPACMNVYHVYITYGGPKTGVTDSI